MIQFEVTIGKQIGVYGDECLANIITGVRIICSVVLLFCTPLSGMFYVVYLTAGLTDMADGAIARRTNSVSEFGTKLDTFADFVFVVVCLSS